MTVPDPTVRPKLIVTGLSGLIGSKLVEAASADFELINLDVTEGVDITDSGQVESLLAEHRDAVALIHLAAFTNVTAAHEQRGDESGLCYRINVVGTRNLVDTAGALGLHLIHVSTDFVFDGRKSGAYGEEDEPNPIEWYGETKLAAERAVKAAPSWTIVRIAFPYVAGPAPRPDFVSNLREKLRRGEEAKLFSDQIITPTFAGDVAAGLKLLAVDRPEREVFHLTGSQWLSPFELGQKIAGVFGFEPSLVQPSLLSEYLKTDPRPRQRALRMSNDKWRAHAARRGLRPPRTVDEGLAEVKRLAESS